MAQPAARRATYQDVLDAPPNAVAEVVFGVLHTFPRPRIRHTVASSTLGFALGGLGQGSEGRGGWVLLDEPELHLGAAPDIVVPDLAGWRRERLPQIPDTAFLTLSPDWVCEVLSPSTQAFDRADKMEVYRREGVTYVWHIEPEGRTLEVFRLDPGTGRYLHIAAWRGDPLVHAEPFEQLELRLATLWTD